MQCPACNHSGSTKDFGQPARCPECDAFYEKALVARAKRNELAANLEAKKERLSSRQQAAAAPGVIDRMGMLLGKGPGRNLLFGAGISFVALVGIGLWAKPGKPIEHPANTYFVPPPATYPRAREPNEYDLRRIGEKNVLARLKDPDSAKFGGQFVGSAGIPCGEVNSKNSFGGYTGFQRYMASGGGLVFIESDMAADEFQKAWMKLCR